MNLRSVFLFANRPQGWTNFAPEFPGEDILCAVMYKFPGDVVYHVAKHRIKERTGNSGRGGLGRALVSFIDTLLLTKYRRDVAERSFWKALRPRRGKVSTNHLRVFLPPWTTTAKVCLWINFVASSRLPAVYYYFPAVARVPASQPSKMRLSRGFSCKKRDPPLFFCGILWPTIKSRFNWRRM